MIIINTRILKTYLAKPLASNLIKRFYVTKPEDYEKRVFLLMFKHSKELIKELQKIGLAQLVYKYIKKTHSKIA